MDLVKETHRVEIVDAELLDGFNFLVTFRDLDRSHREWRECLSRSEADGLAIGDRGRISQRYSRVIRRGRWAFEADPVAADAGA